MLAATSPRWAFSLYQLSSIVAGAATGMLIVFIGLGSGLLGAAFLYSFGCVIEFKKQSGQFIILLSSLVLGFLDYLNY
jgi:hypothetical protein